VSILSLSVGSAMVWTSPYLAYLKSDKSPLTKPITSDEAAILGGLMPIGGLVGSFLYGRLADKIGRFWALYLNAVPQIVSYISSKSN
jgi:MFS family permease